MKMNYSFLKDELALAEIRKHKWIESEKQGQEIGFATAAIDWIVRYGQPWLQYRESLNHPTKILKEKRHLRRFVRKFPLKLKIKNKKINSITEDISEIGLSCYVPLSIPNDTQTHVRIEFSSVREKLACSQFQFQSRIVRVSKKSNRQQGLSYKVFLPFNEEVRNFIRSHAKVLLS